MCTVFLQIAKRRIRFRILGNEEILGKSQNFKAGQSIGDKFTKLIKIGLPLERFTADFLQFSRTTVEIWFSGGRLGAWH